MTTLGVLELSKLNISDYKIIVDKFITRSNNLKTRICELNKDTRKKDTIIYELLSDIYLHGLLMNYAKTMIIIHNDSEWVEIENILIEHIKNFNLEEKLNKQLLKLSKIYKNKETKELSNIFIFLNKLIIKNMSIIYDTELNSDIDRLENKIMDNLLINPIFKIELQNEQYKQFQLVEKNNKSIYSIELNDHNYYKLISLVNNSDILSKIYNTKIACSNSSLKEFYNLLILRHKLANTNNKSSFYKYINRDNINKTETIANLIKIINKNIDVKTKKEINSIITLYQSDYGKIKKLTNIHISKIIKDKLNKYHFKPQHVFTVIFQKIKELFDIDIVIDKNTKIDVWDNNTILFNVLQSKNLKGKLFLNYFSSAKKTITNPYSLCIGDKIKISKKTVTIPECALICNYDIHNPITYDQIILIFKEFGFILQNLCHDSHVGFINSNKEYRELIPFIFECIASDMNFIKNILQESGLYSTDNLNEIYKIVNIKKCIITKNKFINHEFDQRIHSRNFIKHLVKLNDKYIDNFLINAYLDIYKTYFPYHNYEQIQSINPLTLINEINSNQGNMYSQILNELFGFCCYHQIINENKGIEFRKLFFDITQNSYENKLSEYLKDFNNKQHQFYIDNYFSKIDENIYFNELIDSTVDTSNIGITEK
jgi:hypothetical protein